jgi:hypothetical protein
MKGRPWETGRRTAARWTVGLLFIVGGLGAAAVNEVTGYDAGQLLAHGARASATVKQVTYGKNSNSVEVDFMDKRGVVQDDWIEGVPHQYGVSSLLPVVYDQSEPWTASAVSTAEQQSGTDMVFAALFGAAFVGLGLLTLWRGVPKGLGGWAYNRDYLPGTRRRLSS